MNMCCSSVIVTENSEWVSTYNAVNSKHVTVVFLGHEVTCDVCKHRQVIAVLTGAEYVVNVMLADNLLQTVHHQTLNVTWWAIMFKPYATEPRQNDIISGDVTLWPTNTLSFRLALRPIKSLWNMHQNYQSQVKYIFSTITQNYR